MLPMVVALIADLLLELKVVLSKGLDAPSKSFDGVSELLRREFGVGLHGWLRRGRRRGLRCHVIER